VPPSQLLLLRVQVLRGKNAGNWRCATGRSN